MFLASDNTGPALPQVMAALADVNTGHVPSYGADDVTMKAIALVREVFEAPEAAVFFVATGTAANALALSTLAQPWQTVFCTPLAHIHTDECHAPEFFTGGAKLSLVGEDDKMTPTALHAAIEGWTLGDVHVSQRGPVSVTQVTEMGRLYSLEELAGLSAVAADYDLPVHLDGARFANAIAALGCTPAEMTWKVGIDAVSFGGTKNGCLGVEAVILFNPAKAWEFELRRKRAAHLFSKHRTLSAQMLGYLTDGAWLEAAHRANARCTLLAEGLRGVPDCRFAAEPQANMIFARLPRRIHRRLHEAGAVYGLYEGPLETGDPDEPLLMRLVCDWSITEDQIDQFVGLTLD